MLLNKRIIPGITEDSWGLERIPSMTAYDMFYYIQSGGHFICTEGYEKTRQGCDSLLLLYTLKGSGYLDYGGKKYTVSSGMGFLIDCNYPQSYGFRCIADCPNWEFIFLHFNGGESKKYVIAILEASSPVFKAEPQSAIPTAMEELLVMLKNRDTTMDVSGSVLLLHILTELYLKSHVDSDNGKMPPETVSDILYTIERTYAEKITLDGLSHTLNVSKYHMLRLFKKHTGYSIHEYLLKYRLNEAKAFLRDTEMPVEKIAQAVGFEDCAHFCRSFKASEHITPTVFRKSWR